MARPRHTIDAASMAAIREEKEDQAAERFMLWCALDAYRDILRRDQAHFAYTPDEELTYGQRVERRKLRALERVSAKAKIAYEEGLK